MNKTIIDFLNDYVEVPYSKEMMAKYYRKLPTVTLKEVVDYVMENNIAEKLIRSDFYGDGRDIQGPYLMKHVDGYESFWSERGGKHQLAHHEDIEGALMYYLRQVLNEYGLTLSRYKI